MNASPILPIASQYRPAPFDPDTWADIQHTEAERAGAAIVRVLAGQQQHFDFCAVDGRTIQLNANGLLVMSAAQLTDDEIPQMVAALVSLDPGVRTRGIMLAQQAVAMLAGRHADRIADRSCGLRHA